MLCQMDIVRAAFGSMIVAGFDVVVDSLEMCLHRKHISRAEKTDNR